MMRRTSLGMFFSRVSNSLGLAEQNDGLKDRWDDLNKLSVH